MKIAALFALVLAGCCCSRTTCCPTTAQPPTTPPPMAPPSGRSPMAEVPFPSCDALTQVVPFVLGESDLKGGDEVVITSIKGDRARMETGGTYCVWGRYVLHSHPRASLCLWSTDGDTEGYDEDRCRDLSGSGEFRFRFRVVGRLGSPHISYYPVEGGSSLGGVYLATRTTRSLGTRQSRRINEAR